MPEHRANHDRCPQVVTGSLAGVRFAFRSDHPELLAYAQAHLAPLAGGVEQPVISVLLHWHEGQPPRDRGAGVPRLADMERVDRDLYIDGERLCWFRVDDLRDLYLQMTWKDERLTVVGDFYHRLGNSRMSDAIRRARQWRRRRMMRTRRFTTLLAYLVYYPCWWWLEQTQNQHPIHAAGVRIDSTVVLLAGASGVGKSTLAVALANAPGGALLADSFVVHNGAEVVGVREPVLLDAWSRRWLGADAGCLEEIDWRYVLGRRGYHLPPERLVDGGRCGLLLFPRRAPERYMRRISPEQAHQRLSAADLIINDLRRYWAFAAVLEHMVPGKLVARREAQLAKLTAEVPCYELGLTAEMTCAATVESILELLPSRSLHAVGSRR